jgi:hypothetical protein
MGYGEVALYSVEYDPMRLAHEPRNGRMRSEAARARQAGAEVSEIRIPASSGCKRRPLFKGQ